MPVFAFNVDVYEIECVMCLKKNKIKRGKDDRILFKKLYFELIFNPEADIEKVGHPWQICRLFEAQRVEALL